MHGLGAVGLLAAAAVGFLIYRRRRRPRHPQQHQSKRQQESHGHCESDAPNPAVDAVSSMPHTTMSSNRDASQSDSSRTKRSTSPMLDSAPVAAAWIQPSAAGAGGGSTHDGSGQQCLDMNSTASHGLSMPPLGLAMKTARSSSGSHRHNPADSNLNFNTDSGLDHSQSASRSRSHTHGSSGGARTSQAGTDASGAGTHAASTALFDERGVSISRTHASLQGVVCPLASQECSNASCKLRTLPGSAEK